MHLRYLDLIGAAVIILFTLAIAFTGVLPQANGFPFWFWPFGVSMVLFIPGYALTLAILPNVDRTATFLLSLGISVSMDILGGLILHYTPWGLQPVSWAVWLSGISLPCCMVAAYHRSLMPSAVPVQVPALKWNRKVIFSFLVSCFLIGTAIFVSRYFALQSGNNFTQLWAIPARNGSGYVVEIGICNQEQDDKQYTLLVESRGIIIEEWNNIDLPVGQTWTMSLPFNEKPVAPITFSLFMTDTPNDLNETYRMVRLVPASFDAIATQTAGK